jgi:hypothetical protein
MFNSCLTHMCRPITSPSLRSPLCDSQLTTREDFTSLLIDERKAQTRGPLAQLSEVPCALVGVVRMCAGIFVDEVTFEHVIHEDGELAGGDSNGVRFARACGEPAIERTQRGGRAAERSRGQSKRVRGPIRGGLGLRAQEPPAGNLVLRRERQPGSEVLRVGQRRMSVPTSAMSLSAVYAPMPSICERSTPPVW